MKFTRSNLGLFDKDVFASALRTARLDAGLTQEEVARRCWASRSTISRLERAKTRKPDPYVLVDLLNMFELVGFRIVKPIPTRKYKPRRTKAGP